MKISKKCLITFFKKTKQKILYFRGDKWEIKADIKLTNVRKFKI